MKKYYFVSFQYSENVYCTNIAHAETVEDINAHYSKYEWVSVSDCKDYELESAQRKGMPIIEIENQKAITEESVQEDTETLKKYNTWDDLKKCKDKRILIVALQELKRSIGYEPQASDINIAIWDDHLKVIAC